jgi:hypothetical protein
MKAFFLSILLVAGCSDPMPPSVTDLNIGYCTVNVPEEQLSYIQAAMDEWNEKTQYTHWTLNQDCNSTIEVVAEIEDRSEMVGKTFRSDNMRIQVESVVTGEWLQAVMLHELGHVAHLEHSDNPADIMFHSASGEKHLSGNDLKEFHSVNWQ